MCFVDTWEAAQAARTGAAVKKLRVGTDWSAQELADRANEISGLKMTRQMIADLESGRRRYVTTAEVIALAATLGVPPISLVYPGPDYGEYIDVLPGRAARKIDAVQWFSGIADHGLITDAQGAERAHIYTEYGASTRELFLWRDLLAVQRRISSVVRPSRRVNGEIIMEKLSDKQRADLDAWHDQEYSLKLQLMDATNRTPTARVRGTLRRMRQQ